jgi:hypothetical protein
MFSLELKERSSMSIENMPIYREKYVAFLDLMGFKPSIDRTQYNSTAHKKIHDTLAVLKDTLYNGGRSGAQFTYFSDCIVFTTDRTYSGFADILHGIEVVTNNMLNLNFLVRGGLVVGNVYHDQNLVYGPALNQAYEIERNEAVFPMTTASREVLEDAKKYSPQFCKEVLHQDERGQYFVHYLRVYVEYAKYKQGPPTPGVIIRDYDAKRLVDFIRYHLHAHRSEQNVYELYAWFQNYWNNEVASGGWFDRIEDDGDVIEREPEPGGTIISIGFMAGPRQ